MADARARIALVGDVSLTDNSRTAMLNAAAEHQWEELTRCTGSYLVIAETRGHRFICGDLAGLRSVFYVAEGGHTTWSTSARQLADRRQAPVDLALVTAQATVGPEYWLDRTPFVGVRAVPGGCGLLLDGATTRVIDVEDIEPTSTLAEGAPALGAALERAVDWRMRAAGGLASADVSGGLDSSSLAVLASEMGEVRAVTYADAYTSTEDLAYARRVADHINTELHVGLGGHQHLPCTWSLSQPVPPAPAAASLAMDQYALYLKPAAGLPVHFTGNGGDVVLDAPNAVWVGMVQAGEKKAAYRHVANWARARNRSPRELWSVITEAATTGRAEALREAAAQLTSGGAFGRRPGVFSWCHLGWSNNWLTPDGRHQVAELLQEAADASTPVRADLAEQRANLRMVAADARNTVPLEAAWGVRQTHPYLDNEVVRASFSIHPAQRRGVATFKPVLAAALPQLPTWLTSRTSKGSFTREGMAGMIENRPRLAQLFRESVLATSGLLDAEQAVNALAAVETTQANALYDLHRLAMACQWLAAFDAHGRRPLEVAC
ncbi:asparagine synthase-related protein [Streptomyces noursei]|uniref:asparagine synthase-related protein n=1 Tax=Streptomyces noursei TaxID=1971 RepID=UPI0037F9DD5A